MNQVEYFEEILSSFLVWLIYKINFKSREKSNLENVDRLIKRGTGEF